MALTQVDLGLLSPSNAQEVGMRNRIIDGGFIINQRGYVSGTSLSAGTYAHDRWKAGAGGCTYTFTQGALGVNTTITITAGSLIQVIEGCNVAEGGTYVLSWTGTAQGRLNGGSYGASGITITGWTAGTNLNVEFNTGTVGSVQLEKGSTATSFDYRPYGTELALCQRYYQLAQGFVGTSGGTTNQVGGAIQFKTEMRASPSIGQTAIIEVTEYGVSDWAQTSTSILIPGGGVRVNSKSINFALSNFSGLTTSRFYNQIVTSSSGSITLSAEL